MGGANRANLSRVMLTSCRAATGSAKSVWAPSVWGTALADNGSFVLNAIETMAADPVLAGCGAAVSTPGLLIELNLCVKRPKASILAEQERLEAEIQETERRLGQLQQAQAGSQASLLLSPEQEAEVDQLQDKVIAARKQLRLVQLNLRTDIEQLGTNLMLFNTIVWPLAVAALSGMIFLMREKSVVSKKEPHYMPLAAITTVNELFGRDRTSQS